MPRLTILLLILTISVTLMGQLSDNSKPLISGVIIDDSTRQAIPFAHIFNESKRTGSISNEEGNFKIHADIGDTLVVTAVGYLGRAMVAGDLWIDQNITIVLIPRIYEIAAVSIRAFKDYADFQRQFIALDLPKSETRKLRDNLIALARKEVSISVKQDEVRKVYSPQPGIAPVRGPTILYRDDLQRIHYAKYLELEKKQRIIDKKYNREIIYNITRLTEDEITDFMGFCNFSMDYLYNASEYDILVRIEEKFKQYQARKSQGDLLKEIRADLIWFT